MEEVWKPTVGDWVVITTLKSKKHGGMTGIVGHVFQIKNISREDFCTATEDTYITGTSWPFDCIRKAKPHEIPGYVKPVKENYKYLIPIIKNINEIFSIK